MFVFLKFVYCVRLLGTLIGLVCLGSLWLFAAQTGRIAVLLLEEFIGPWEVSGVGSGFVRQLGFKWFSVAHLKLLSLLDLL